MFYLIVKDSGGRLITVESYSERDKLENAEKYWSRIKFPNGKQKYTLVKTETIKN